MAKSRPPRILVIDDEPRVREFLYNLLTGFGYDADTAADGAEGLALFDRGGYDLVLTDLAMPGMSGWEVVGAVRRRAADMELIMITGLASEADMARAREWGLTLLEKPFQIQELKTVVARALRAGPVQSR